MLVMKVALLLIYRSIFHEMSRQSVPPAHDESTSFAVNLLTASIFSPFWCEFRRTRKVLNCSRQPLLKPVTRRK